MRTLLLAHDTVGLEIAEFLLTRYGDDIAAVVTTEEDDISALARAHSVKTLVYQSADGVADALNQPLDVGILAWWPKIIPSELIAIPARGFVNTHPSLLPQNRGKHTSFWAIVEEAPFGATVHSVDSGIDSGGVITQREISYDWCDTAKDLHCKAKAVSAALFKEVYPELRAGPIAARPQPFGDGSYHRSSEINTASRIDLDRAYTGREFLNLLRARTYPGFPGCRFQDAGETYEVTVTIRKVDDK
ncbi:MAG: formyltransferase family protein [Paracoccaceae bacterium]|nr:formyltransferase family protein [Paracoccaceae bacterium]